MAPIPLELYDHDYLITKKKLEENDDLSSFVTPVSSFLTHALGDFNMKTLKQGDIIQLERKGYFIVDKPWGEYRRGALSEPGVERRVNQEGRKECVELILIPDGRAGSIQSKFELGATAITAKKEPNEIPLSAPLKPVEIVLLSNGNSGYEIPLKTKMYRSFIDSTTVEAGKEAALEIQPFASRMFVSEIQ